MNLHLACIHKNDLFINILKYMDFLYNLLELLYTSRPIIYKPTNPDTQMYIHYCNNFKHITIEEWNLLDKYEKERYQGSF